jgi:starch-binding outer membrane protein, SusD/RagB family
MNLIQTMPAVRRRGIAKTIALVAAFGTLALTACEPSQFLDVETPDIVDPRDVQSPAGAEAVRIGALSRFVQATTGSESFLLLGGLAADEWVNGDTFIDRHQLDRRDITPDNAFLTTASRNLHRARLSAEQAIGLLERYAPAGPGWHIAEMQFVQAYLVNLAAEHYCDGLVFSTVGSGGEEFGTPMTTRAAYERALGHANAGLALITGTTANDLRVRHALQVTRGRILMNLDRPADAATAVQGVPNTFVYRTQHSSSTYNNHMWNWNVSARRYSVGNNEGQNGLNFATAGDPRVPVCQTVSGNPGACLGVQLGREDASRPLHLQQLWTAQFAPVTLINGIAARMIEAEAQLRANDVPGMLATLNAARATVSGLAPLADPGTVAARRALLFRERAFWHYGVGQRFGDLRRLVRQYGMPANTVFPTGAWHKAGGTYGGDVNFPVPLSEANNPNVNSNQLCMNRDA